MSGWATWPPSGFSPTWKQGATRWGGLGQAGRAGRPSPASADKVRLQATPAAAPAKALPQKPPKGQVGGEHPHQSVPGPPKLLLLQEGLHIALDTGPVHVDVAHGGQHLHHHENQAQPNGHPAPNGLDGIAHGEPSQPPEGELADVGLDDFHTPIVPRQGEPPSPFCEGPRGRPTAPWSPRPER